MLEWTAAGQQGKERANGSAVRGTAVVEMTWNGHTTSMICIRCDLAFTKTGGVHEAQSWEKDEMGNNPGAQAKQDVAPFWGPLTLSLMGHFSEA